jgi:DNA-binding GntR family transcriptional regulator
MMIHENLTHKVDSIQNTAEVIAKSLEEKIYGAELKPGQQLVQENIARMFGVSRVPVRDALQILINMGLAVNMPRRGVYVRRLSNKSLTELFEVRKILEGSAIRLAVQRITPEDLNTLFEIIGEQQKALKDKNVKLNEKLDSEFHSTIFRSLENGLLIDLITANWARIKQARCTSTANSEHGIKWIAESIQRHKKLLGALSKKDAELACTIVVQTIEDSQQEITLSLEQMGWLDLNNDASI